ncbi:hypothetical protein GF312_21690 [Candidatus Poribacteria bacterium]|nr:hypothetical protein [Candidatus Poribacteria bacterium]
MLLSIKNSVGFILFILVPVIFCICCSPEEKEEQQIQGGDLSSFVIIQKDGWHKEQNKSMKKPDDIWDYAGKDGELYQSYGVIGAAIAKYKNEKSLKILVEIYEFTNSEDAYGLYSFDTVGESMDIGQESVFNHGLLKFWKDKFLVRIIAEEEFPQLKKDIISFAREVDSRILSTGSKPQLLAFLPNEKKVPNSLHYFHQNICLNNIFYIPESSELCLSDQTKAVTAEYAYGTKQPTQFILIEYPENSQAISAFASFGELYFQGEKISSDQNVIIARMAEEQYDSMAIMRNFIIIILEARHPDICRKLMAETLTNIELHGRRKTYKKSIAI